ncbi:MAG: glycoside hydrolase family 10 protein [Candidatus Bathyarchaeia archaeon]
MRPGKVAVMFCIILLLYVYFFHVKAGDSSFSDMPLVEGRGIWVYATSFKNAEELEGNLTLFKSLNINMVFFLVKGWKYVHYNSSIRPSSPVDWDPLRVAVEKARELGLELHAWFAVFRDPYLAKNQSLAMKYSNGKYDPNWTCPANPTVRNHLLELIREIVTNYSISGIHLDYIRYNNSSACYCEHCIEAYRNETGRNPPYDPKDPDWKNWMNWRVRQISSFVNATYNLVKGLRPNIKVSAYVFPKIKDAVEGVFQNWTEWIQKRYVDFLTPGAYTNNMTDFKNRVNEALNASEWKVPLYIGIGVHEFNKTRDPLLIAEQVNITRVLGAEGQVFFRYFKPCEPGYCNLSNVLWKALEIVYKNQPLTPHNLTRNGTIIPIGNKRYPSIIYSNSTIENFYFNATEKSININVSGTVNTTGLTIAKLPESLVKNEWGGNVSVFLSGVPWPFQKVSASEWIYVSLKYKHEASIKIRIIPEFSNLLGAALIAIFSTLLCLHLFKRIELTNPRSK